MDVVPPKRFFELDLDFSSWSQCTRCKCTKLIIPQPSAFHYPSNTTSKPLHTSHLSPSHALLHHRITVVSCPYPSQSLGCTSSGGSDNWSSSELCKMKILIAYALNSHLITTNYNHIHIFLGCLRGLGEFNDNIWVALLYRRICRSTRERHFKYL